MRSLKKIIIIIIIIGHAVLEMDCNQEELEVLYDDLPFSPSPFRKVLP